MCLISEFTVQISFETEFDLHNDTQTDNKNKIIRKKTDGVFYYRHSHCRPCF